MSRPEASSKSAREDYWQAGFIVRSSDLNIVDEHQTRIVEDRSISLWHCLESGGEGGKLADVPARYTLVFIVVGFLKGEMM